MLNLVIVSEYSTRIVNQSAEDVHTSLTVLFGEPEECQLSFYRNPNKKMILNGISSSEFSSVNLWYDAINDSYITYDVSFQEDDVDFERGVVSIIYIKD